MEIKEYVISIAACTIAGSCITRVFEKSKLIKILCGIFISFSILRPLLDFDLKNTFPSLQVFSTNANAIVEDAKTNTAIREQAIIKQNIEEYICDKASEMGCEIVVTVLLSDDAPYLPQAITLEGDISPYARNTLSKLIETDIGISPEEQQWNG